MDVGAPSNFERMLALAGGSVGRMRENITGFPIDDATTRATMLAVWRAHGYQLDPHTAVGWRAAEAWLARHPDDHPVILATAHPAKFLEIAADVFGPDAVVVPDRLACLADLPKVSIPMAADEHAFTAWLASGGGMTA